MAERLEGIELPVDALIQIGVDPGSISALQASFQAFGRRAGETLASGVQKGTGNVFEDINKAVADIPKRAARDQAWKQFAAQLVKVAKEAEAALAATGTAGATANAKAAAEVRKLIAQVQALNSTVSGQRASTTQATAATNSYKTAMSGLAQALIGVANGQQQVGATYRATAAPTQAAQAGSTATQGLIDDLQRLFAATKGNEAAWKDLATVIVASVNKAARELSKDIVGEQTAQQLRGIQKAAQQQAFQAQKDAARQALQQQKALDREQEQSRATSARAQLSQQKSALAQENAAFNASLQSNLVAEKGFQQRRTALVQAGLLATRSLYQSLSSGASSVISGAYNAMVSATRRGEDQITAANRQGLQERRRQTELITQQTVAQVRRDQGSLVAAQTQLDQGGVLGALTGQSRAGAAIRGAAIGGGVISALGIKQAVDFESAMADVSKTVDGTAEVMASLRQGIIDLAKEIPSTREEIAGVATVAGQLGIEAPNILGFSKVMIDLGNSTNVAAEEAADLLAKFATVTQMDQGNFDRLGSTIVALGNNFAGTEKDIIAMAQRLSSAGALAGLAEPEIVGIANALVSVGIEAEAGGTAFSRAIGDLAKAAGTGGEAIAPFAEVAGLTADKFQALFKSNPAAAITEFITGLGKVKDEGGNLFQVLDDIGFKEIRLSNAFRSLAGSGDLFTKSIDTATTAWQENSALVTEATIRYQTAASRFQITKNRLTDVSRQLGEIVVPILVSVTSALEPILVGAGAALQKISTGFRALARVAAPVLDIIRKALVGIVAAIGGLVAVKAGVEVIKLLGLALSTLASPIGVVVLALSAIGGAIGFVLTQSEPLREALGRLADRFKGVASGPAVDALGKVEEVFDKVRARVERAAEVVGFFITLLIDSDIRKRFVEWQELDPNVEKEGLLGFFLNLIDAVPKVIKAIIDGFSEAVGFIRRVATDPAFETFRKAVLGAAAGVGALVVAIKGINAAKVALTGLRTVATVAAGFASPFGIAALAIGALAAGFVILYQKSEPFRRLVDGLVEGVKEVALTVLRAAMPALEAFAGVIKDSAGRALEGLQGVLESVVAFVGSAGFTNALTKVGEIVGGVIERIAAGFQQVVDFITAVSRVISDLGVFEGLKGAVVVAFEGITGFIGDIFSTIGETIAGFFSGIDWATVAATAAAGIFNFFRTIGRTVGRFIGSKEFLTTVAVALAALAATIASAAGGLVTGLIEGLRDSDAGQQIIEFFRELIGLGSDEIEGSGDVVAEAVRKATVDGLTLALSAAFPPELFRRLFTDPLGSALGAAVLLVEVLFIGKIVKMFVSGFQTVQRTIQGIALAPKVLQGGLASISDDLRNTGTAARNNAQDLSRVNQQYGTFAGRIVKVADTVNGFGKGQEQVASTTQAVSKNIDGQTAALLRNEAAARGNISNITATTTEERKRSTVIETVKDNYLALAGAIAGGAVAGAGIGAALVADDPLGKIAGITAAIGGIGTIAVTTAQVISTAGLTAGLLTGGVGLAVTAITTAITLLVGRQKEASAAAKAAEEAADGVRNKYTDLFRDIISKTGGSALRSNLELLSKIEVDGKNTYKELSDAAKEYKLSIDEIAKAITGTDAEYKQLTQTGETAIGISERRIEELERRAQVLREQAVERGDLSFRESEENRALEDAIARERERKALLEQTGSTLGIIRQSYLDQKEATSAELAIRREIKAIEEQRQTALDQIVTKTEAARDALDAQVNALLTIADLEAGRTDVPRAERELRQGLRSIVDSFLPTRDAEGRAVAPTASFAAPVNSAQFDAALDATESYRRQVALIAADVANNSATQEEYNQKIHEQAAAYQQLLQEAGASPQIANQIVQGLFNGFTDGRQVINAFLTESKDGIDALRASLQAPWVTEVVAELDEGPARDALIDFISSPDPKNIEALFDLGIPKEVLDEFIKAPSDKTIQPIVAALQQADQDRLNTLTSPERKFLTVEVVVDPQALANTRRQIQSNLRAGTFNPLTGVFNKYGSIITEPTLTWVGEEKRKEVIIPLTMPNRAAQLYEQSGLANVLARAGVAAPGVPQVVATTGAGPTRQEFDRVVGVLESLRGDLREDMDTRRDNVFLMEGVDKPYPTARQTASKLRRKRRRR